MHGVACPAYVSYCLVSQSAGFDYFYMCECVCVYMQLVSTSVIFISVCIVIIDRILSCCVEIFSQLIE